MKLRVTKDVAGSAEELYSEKQLATLKAPDGIYHYCGNYIVVDAPDVIGFSDCGVIGAKNLNETEKTYRRIPVGRTVTLALTQEAE